MSDILLIVLNIVFIVTAIILVII
ncbi:TPA: hypothetical protein ACM36I_003684 [Escherichia coli]|uniref:NADH dehydrogenase subunit 1 n=1 Tax=Escherichia coli TaxID=562 RepID=A0ABD5C6W7_ECOLX|nr:MULTISPECIES: hypothetical protein [Enterobacteriaceae]EHK1219573.1 hypothetical protein [Escherichia coli]EHK1244412.1 hypothetical protein [Escherichia coli]EHK3057364.1 hypothetical protein [Escherichia coli]EHP1875656.1 hypothetical protein [Escherichia coli]EHR8821658.1 hypothetical protein [Escherichia coli]